MTQKVEGTLSVQPQANPVKGFEEYFLNLNVENNRRNPWFVGKYQKKMRCKRCKKKSRKIAQT